MLYASRSKEKRIKHASRDILNPLAFSGLLAVLLAGAAATTVQAKEWQATAGAESSNRGSQALAFLPNELWVHAGDSIRWTFMVCGVLAASLAVK